MNEHLDRLRMMSTDDGETWDLSDNDREALAWAVETLERKSPAAREAEALGSVSGVNDGGKPVISDPQSIPAPLVEGTQTLPKLSAEELAMSLRTRANLLCGEAWELPATTAMMREAADLLTALATRQIQPEGTQTLKEATLVIEQLQEALLRVEWVKRPHGSLIVCAHCGQVPIEHGGPDHADDCEFVRLTRNSAQQLLAALAAGVPQQQKEKEDLDLRRVARDPVADNTSRPAAGDRG